MLIVHLYIPFFLCHFNKLGGILKLYGKIYSGVYGSNVPSAEITNGVTERILR